MQVKTEFSKLEGEHFTILVRPGTGDEIMLILDGQGRELPLPMVKREAWILAQQLLRVIGISGTEV